ncbi:MAG: branched-chain amino acid ABC transporter permease [Chromatiales bacterium]|jgi:branched-chain amino acid transport system permease protein|nr:branched-chain amino acid ABC transporter permease [Chromatiales bacterium]
MNQFIEISINGIIAGSLYALIAVAFVIVYKASKIINFALGELVMVGASLVAVGLHVLELGLALSIVFACVGMFVLAAAFNEVVLRRVLSGRVIALIMVTIGFGAFLRALAAMAFAGVPTGIELPIPPTPLEVNGILLSLDELAVGAIAFVVVVLVSWFFASSRTGMALRALADDREAAMGMGVNVQWHFALAWGLAGTMAVAGGVLWTSFTGGGFSMALVGLKVFPIVIVGGLDSIRGALVGAMLIGWLESMASWYIGGGVSTVVAFAFLLAMLIARPHGLFGRPDIERV